MLQRREIEKDRVREEKVNNRIYLNLKQKEGLVRAKGEQGGWRRRGEEVF